MLRCNVHEVFKLRISGSKLIEVTEELQNRLLVQSSIKLK